MTTVSSNQQLALAFTAGALVGHVAGGAAIAATTAVARGAANATTVVARGAADATTAVAKGVFQGASATTNALVEHKYATLTALGSTVGAYVQSDRQTAECVGLAAAVAETACILLKFRAKQPHGRAAAAAAEGQQPASRSSTLTNTALVLGAAAVAAGVASGDLKTAGATVAGGVVGRVLVDIVTQEQRSKGPRGGGQRVGFEGGATQVSGQTGRAAFRE